MSHILILAALPEEAAAIYASVPGSNEDFLGFNVRCVTVRDIDIAIVTTGIGKVNAALAAGVFGVDADIILMAGTCGALNAEAGPYWIAQAVQHDYGHAKSGRFTRYRAGELPVGDAGPLNFIADADFGLGLPHAHIASGDCFVADADAAAEMAQALDVQLVDMEVAAVAQAATQMGKPWAAIKAVSDNADGASGDDFRANLRRAAGQSAAAIEKWIKLYSK